ncbi:MAG: electron transport complex subunit RsxE [Gammaproteobacteria bacterium]|nr:electron transport complex subunit RsxE [Gammaproteobacteria bacterium]
MKPNDFTEAAIANNPAWAQLLGLCPLLAVSNTVANATGLALASAFVVIGSNTSISLLRRIIPDIARLPCFVLIIATFTTLTVMLLEAYAFDLYSRIALFVQIIVTNCMILGRAEVFASRQPVGRALMDALGTAVGFSLALLALGAVREVLGQGSLMADMDLLFGPAAAALEVKVFAVPPLALALLPPGAFIIAGLLFALVRGLGRTARDTRAHAEQ